MPRSFRAAVGALLAIALSALALTGLTAPASATSHEGTAVSVPITGAGVAGTFEIDRFVRDGSMLNAVGTFTGTAGTVTGSQQIAMPVDVAQSSGTCEILTLVLGPLDLNLLGLRVQLNQVVLEITAEQGSGNLLGNLLCAVAGLLDNPSGGLSGILQRLAGLLNQILGALG